jgi:hypothetical protein
VTSRPAVGHRAEVDDGQHRRQHRQRAEDRDRHHQDRSERHRREHAEAGEQEPGEPDHDGRAGDHDRAADGRRQRRLGARTCATFRALTPDVEQRVIDPGREPDQHDDRRRRGSVWRDLRDEPERPQGGADRTQAEQQRHGRGDQRTEREHQDQQRDRDRDQLSAVQAARDQLVDRVVARTGSRHEEGDAAAAVRQP